MLLMFAFLYLTGTYLYMVAIKISSAYLKTLIQCVGVLLYSHKCSLNVKCASVSLENKKHFSAEMFWEMHGTLQKSLAFI